MRRARINGATEGYLTKGGLGGYWRSLIAHYGDVFCDQIITADVESYVAARLQQGVRRQTISRELVALRRGIGPSEIKWPKLRRDPPNEALRGKHREPELLARWLAELSPEARAQALFAAATGLRKGELRRVQWAWVKGDLLHMPAEATKSKRARIVALAPEARALLRDAAKAGDPPWAHRDFHKSYKMASERLGIRPHVSLRDLRHTFATEALARSGDAAAVMAVLGHRDLAMTARYQHSTLNRARTVAAVTATVFATVAPSARRGKQ